MSESVSAGRKAVVIGAGFGGLAAAIRLGARGYQVTVVDKLDKPGGRAYVYEDDGFVFDAGPTIVTAPFLLEELWALCGKEMSEDLELVPMNPYYRILFADGEYFDYCGDDAAMKAEIARFNPADVAGYEQLLEASSLLYDIGFDKLLAVSFDSIPKMIKTIPDLLKGQFYRSVHSLVARYIKHPKLRMVFSFHPLLIGGNPFTATAIYALIGQLERLHGVHFAMGGTGRIVQGLVGLIEGQGGTIRLARTGPRDPGPGRSRARRATGRRGNTGGRYRGVQRGLRGHLPPAAAGAIPQTLDQQKAGPVPLLHEPVRVVLRHQKAVSGCAPPHDHARRAIQGVAVRYL